MKIKYSALTNKGRIRKENQDSLLLAHRSINADDFFESETIEAEAPLCFAVFDGMGGGQCGREASVLAAEMLCSLQGALPLAEGCRQINAAIEAYMKEHDLLSMGTTAAALVFNEGAVEICNIGDSGIYCVFQDRMVRLSESHSIQVGGGGRRFLTQYLGLRSTELQIEPFVQTVKAESGYRFLLCSDGLTDLVPETEIAETLAGTPSADACRKLYALAMQTGGKDNISIILADIIS